jgi:2-polyprenyl-3-methyl-5-hydroxy-6-metoxy-1,4-benzoquinol methylase
MVCADVLEHVLDLNLVCAKILSVLRPGGILIVRDPYREDLRAYTVPSCPYKFIHLRNFDENSLQLLF